MLGSLQLPATPAPGNLMLSFSCICTYVQHPTPYKKVKVKIKKINKKENIFQ
jgi:hypothetical protein